MSGAVDLYMIYQFLTRLTTPFKKWDAYEDGIINANGDIIMDKRERKKNRVKLSKFDLLVLKIKNIVDKIPALSSKTRSYAAALWFIKEYYENDNEDKILTEEEFKEYLSLVEENDINEKFETLLETPTMAVSGGQVDGIGYGSKGEPGFTQSDIDKYKAKTRKKKRERFLNMWNQE